MDTLALARQVEGRIGLGTLKRKRIHAVVLAAVFGALVEWAQILIYQRYHATTPSVDGLTWALFFVAGTLPFLAVLNGFRFMKRRQMSDDAADMFVRVTMGFTSFCYIGMWWILRLAFEALKFGR